MNRVSLLGILASASVLAGAICFTGAEKVRWAEDYAVALIFIAGGLGLWAIIETFKPKA